VAIEKRRQKSGSIVTIPKTWVAWGIWGGELGGKGAYEKGGAKAEDGRRLFRSTKRTALEFYGGAMKKR